MTWTLNLALHRKVAARVRSSASGMQQADGADEVSKTIDAHRLILYRDAVAVATLQWGLPLVVDGEALASPGVPASATILDADIDSGSWTGRLESLDGTYVATTTSVGKSGTDVVVADDLDDENGVSIAVNLLMDDDLSSGGTPMLNPGDGIYQLGDSTTYGHNSIDGNQVATPAPKALEDELDDVYPVTFEGVGLATTSNLISGTGGFSNSLANLLSASSAKVVIYPWGINDSYLISDAQFETNLRDIVTATRSAGKIPILQTPNPTNQNLSAELAIIRAVANDMDVPLIDVHAYLTAQLGGAAVTTMMPDGIHPSQATYLIIGAYQAGRIREIFGTPPSDLAHFPFRADSPWNAQIPMGATYYGAGDARTQEITRTSKPSIPGWTQMGETGGSIKWAVNAQNFAINVFYALPGGPTKTIRVRDMYGSRFDYDVTVPWPAGTHAAMGTDMHLSIIDADGITSHDFWHCQLQGNGDYIAASYSRTRLDGSGWNQFPYSMESPSNPHGRNPAEAVAGVGASRAVSVSCLGGLIRQADVQRGSIDHALAIAVPRTYIRRGPRVWPADPTSSYYDGDGRSTGPLAYSMRFAIPKSVNLNSLGLTANWLMVAKAMQDYGVYIVDVAGIFNPCIYTEYPAAFSFGSALRDASGGQDTHFPKLWSRLQYVDWV